jgi:hypothetical protein
MFRVDDLSDRPTELLLERLLQRRQGSSAGPISRKLACEERQPLREMSPERRKDSIVLLGGILVVSNAIDITQGYTGKFQASLDRVARETLVLLDAAETLLLKRADNIVVPKKGCRTIMIERGNSERQRHAITTPFTVTGWSVECDLAVEVRGNDRTHLPSGARDHLPLRRPSTLRKVMSKT